MLILEIENNDEVIINRLMENIEIRASIVNKKEITGISELTQIIVPLSGIAATLIYNLVKEQIRQKRYIKVKYKDLEISGVEEDKLMEFLDYAIKEVEKLEKKQ